MAARRYDTESADDFGLYAQEQEPFKLNAGVNMKQRHNDEESHLLSSAAFNSFILMAVLANTLLLGIEVDHPEHEVFWTCIENLFTTVFLLELLIKLYILKWSYFHDRGRWLDCILVFAAILDQWILMPLGQVDLQSPLLLRILRILRLARVLRLFMKFKRFSLILVAISEALQTTFWVGSLIGIFIFSLAILCTDVIGRGDVELYPGYTTDATKIDEAETIALFNPYLCFGSMARSMLTLFNIVIGAEWIEIVRPIFLKQPHFALIFVAIMLFLGFGVMNVIIALIVDSVISKTNQRATLDDENEIRSRLSDLNEIRQVLCSLSTDGDGRVRAADLEKYMGDPRMVEMLRNVNLPKGMSAHEILVMLDSDGDGILHVDEIVRGLYQLIDSDSFQRLCLSQMSINKVLAHVTRNAQQNAVTQDMLKSLNSSVSMLLAQLQSNQIHLAQLPKRTPSLAETASQGFDSPAMTLPPIPSANVSRQEAARASAREDAYAEWLPAVTAKIEAQMVQILMDEQVLDATGAKSAAAVCRPKMLKEVVAQLGRERRVEYLERSFPKEGRRQSSGFSDANSPQEDLLPTHNGGILGNHIEKTLPMKPSIAADVGESNEAHDQLRPHGLSEAEDNAKARTCWLVDI